MRSRRMLLNAIGLAMLAGFAACGGGGGGNDPGSVTGATVDISTLNRDSVAHAAVAGVWGLTLGVTAPLATGSSGAGRSMSVWLQSQRERVAGAVQRERPMVVIGPIVEQCLISGSRTATWNDADNDGVLLSVGDVLTGVFDNCQDVAGETTSGTMIITVPSATTLRMAMDQLSFDTTRHAIRLTGSVRLEDVSADTVQTTTEGPVTIAVTLKHLAPAFTDTVTLQEGFVTRETFGNGETVSTFDGLLDSAAAGGVVRLTTPSNTPIRQLATSDYSYTGVLRVEGKNSALEMTVLSADQVQLGLDTNNNGSFESTSTVPWDWLL